MDKKDFPLPPPQAGRVLTNIPHVSALMQIITHCSLTSGHQFACESSHKFNIAGFGDTLPTTTSSGNLQQAGAGLDSTVQNPNPTISVPSANVQLQPSLGIMVPGLIPPVGLQRTSQLSTQQGDNTGTSTVSSSSQKTSATDSGVKM